MALLTMKQLMEKLQVTRSTIYRYTQQGMPEIRITAKSIRYSEEDVMNWLKGRSDKSKGMR